jgi:hypothetical protein
MIKVNVSNFRQNYQIVVGVLKMPDSVYKVIELVGTSPDSWEDAIKAIVAKAAKTLRDLRIAEVILLDAKIEDQKVALFRAKVKLSFKFEA